MEFASKSAKPNRRDFEHGYLDRCRMQCYVDLIVSSLQAAQVFCKQAQRNGCRFTEIPIRTTRWRCPLRKSPRRRLQDKLETTTAEFLKAYNDGAASFGHDYTTGDGALHLRGAGRRRLTKCAPGIAKTALDSALHQVQHSLVLVLQRCIEQKADVKVTTLLSVIDLALRYALWSLQELQARLKQAKARETSYSNVAHLSLWDKSGKDFTEVGSDATALRPSMESTRSSKLPPTHVTDGIQKAQDPQLRQHTPGLKYPAEMFDLSVKVLPTGQPWRWCEGACRARCLSHTLAALSPTAKSTCVEGPACGHCKALTMNDLGTFPWANIQNPWEKARMLDYVAKCHAISRPRQDGPEEAVWVCHVCVNQNPYDGSAGPSELSDLCNHYRKEHEPKKGTLRKKRTPRPLTVYAAWEVQSNEEEADSPQEIVTSKHKYRSLL